MTKPDDNHEENFDVNEFIEKMSKPSKESEAFFAKRRRLGLGVGLDESGNVVHQRTLNGE